MACTCCERYAPKHLDGSALPSCAGTAAIEEASRLSVSQVGYLLPPGVATTAAITVLGRSIIDEKLGEPWE